MRFPGSSDHDKVQTAANKHLAIISTDERLRPATLMYEPGSVLAAVIIHIADRIYLDLWTG